MKDDTNAETRYPHHASIDILGEIFIHCLAEIPPNCHPDDLDPLNDWGCWMSERQVILRQQQPFKLAAVCSNWRAACLATPRVWQNLDISLNGPALIRAGATATMVHDVLRYSGAVSLSVRLFHWYFSIHRHRQWNDPEVELLVAALQAAMARCDTLVVSGHVSRQLVFDPLGRILRVSTPKLRTASLCGDFWVGNGEAGLHPPEASILPNVDQLRHLELDGSFLYGFQDISSCSNVERVTLRGRVWAAQNLGLAFRFLSTAPQLARVIVDNPVEKYMPADPPRAASCEAVQKLLVNMDRDTGPRGWSLSIGLDLNVMLNLSFPRLQAIELRGCAESGVDCLTLLRHLVSPNHTTEVVLHGMSGIIFLPALEQARKLRSLTLVGITFENRERFKEWCDDFGESVRNHGARWQQELEQLCLYDVVFGASQDASGLAELAPFNETVFTELTRLKKFEVVEKGDSYSCRADLAGLLAFWALTESQSAV